VTKPDKAASNGRRDDRKDKRRQQLIEATLSVIARQGFAGTRLSDVARQAGVSYGVVSFYFKTKEDLLLATLQSLADEYTQVWRKAVAEAGDDPADRLRAIIEADFSPRIASEKKIAVWFAFWAESRVRANYRKLCAELFNDFHWQIRTIVQELIDQYGYDHLDANRVTLGINGMTDGMWLDMQIQPRDFDRKVARETIEVFLAQLFPAAFEAPKTETDSRKADSRN